MLWLLAIVPVAGATLVWLTGIESRRWLGISACAVMAATLVLACVAATGWTGHVAWSAALELTAALTPLSAVVAILVPAVALPILAWAAAHEHETGLRRAISLLLVFVGGMELLVVASDFVTLLVGWELVGACSWALIGHEWQDADNPRAGQYAFLMTRFGDLGLFLAGMATFAATGSFGYDALAQLGEPALGIVAFGVLLSAAAKSGQVPFSPWLFRAMAGPTSVSALLHAATMVAAGAYLLVRLEPELARATGFSVAAVAVGATTAVTGGLVALLQGHAKKLLAASTSAHYGLMLVAVGAGHPGIAVLHLVAHAAFKALLFLSAGVAGERAGTFELRAMRVGRALPLAAAASAVGALSLAGVPPLGGAWTKEAIVTAAGHEGAALAIVVMVAGFFSAAYAARFQLLAWGLESVERGRKCESRAELGAMAMLAAGCLALSLLWLPAVHDGVARWLAIELPKPKAWELAASIVLVVLGGSAGIYLARRRRTQPAAASGSLAALADWLGLPVLVRSVVAQPFVRLAGAAARFDDRVVDALPRGVAALAAAVRKAFSRGDRRIVDRLVEAAAAGLEALARLGDRVGERIADSLPEGTATLTASGGRHAPRLQTGMSHHYYVLLAVGAVLIALALLGGS